MIFRGRAVMFEVLASQVWVQVQGRSRSSLDPSELRRTPRAESIARSVEFQRTPTSRKTQGILGSLTPLPCPGPVLFRGGPCRAESQFSQTFGCQHVLPALWFVYACRTVFVLHAYPLLATRNRISKAKPHSLQTFYLKTTVPNTLAHQMCMRPLGLEQLRLPELPLPSFTIFAPNAAPRISGQQAHF